MPGSAACLFCVVPEARSCFLRRSAACRLRPREELGTPRVASLHQALCDLVDCFFPLTSDQVERIEDAASQYALIEQWSLRPGQPAVTTIERRIALGHDRRSGYGDGLPDVYFAGEYLRQASQLAAVQVTLG